MLVSRGAVRTAATFLLALSLGTLAVIGGGYWTWRAAHPPTWDTESTLANHRAQLNVLDVVGHRSPQRPVSSSNMCSPAAGVYFLKTRKTGSSTLATILTRYADMHRASIVLNNPDDPKLLFPKRGDKCWPSAFLDGALPPPPYHIFHAHATYLPNFIDAFMPAGTKRITIVRDPVTRFVSAFKAFNGAQHYGYDHHRIPIKEIISDFIDNKLAGEWVWNQYLNQMAIDFGIRNYCDATPADLDAVLAAMENDFSLILLQERFEESVVLLQDELCWPLSDIVYFDRKVRFEDSAYDWLRPDQIDLIRRMASYDQAIYEKAVELFDARVAAFDGCGSSLTATACVAERVAELNAARAALSAACPEAAEVSTTRDEQTLYSGCVACGTYENVRDAVLERGGSEDLAHVCSVLAMDVYDYTKRLYESTTMMKDMEGFTEETPAEYIESAGYERPRMGECPVAKEDVAEPQLSAAEAGVAAAREDTAQEEEPLPPRGGDARAGAAAVAGGTGDGESVGEGEGGGAAVVDFGAVGESSGKLREVLGSGGVGGGVAGGVGGGAVGVAGGAGLVGRKVDSAAVGVDSAAGAVGQRGINSKPAGGGGDGGVGGDEGVGGVGGGGRDAREAAAQALHDRAGDASGNGNGNSNTDDGRAPARPGGRGTAAVAAGNTEDDSSETVIRLGCGERTVFGKFIHFQLANVIVACVVVAAVSSSVLVVDYLPLACNRPRNAVAPWDGTGTNPADIPGYKRKNSHQEGVSGSANDGVLLSGTSPQASTLSPRSKTSSRTGATLRAKAGEGLPTVAE